MIVASLIATIQLDDIDHRVDELLEDDYVEDDHSTDASQYLNGTSAIVLAPTLTVVLTVLGEYKTILQLVTVLSHGKRMSQSSLALSSGCS